MNRRKESNKISTSGKVTISALSALSLIGGWSIIGNLEHNAAANEITGDEVSVPMPTAVRPSPTPWPTIQPLAQVPRLELEPLPTLPPRAELGETAALPGEESEGTAGVVNLSAAPSAAPLPTLAPLPAMPEYVPPPPPPPSMTDANPSSNGGGSNQSKGS
jgi:hypothetical protein